MPETREIMVEINGEEYRREVEPRLLLSDFIRHEAGLLGRALRAERPRLQGQALAQRLHQRTAGGQLVQLRPRPQRVHEVVQ